MRLALWPSRMKFVLPAPFPKPAVVRSCGGFFAISRPARNRRATPRRLRISACWRNLGRMKNNLPLPPLVSKLLFLIQVSRPMIWPVLPLVYGLGLNASHAPLSVAAIVQILLLTLPMNLVGCGLNDIYDYESDRRSPRRRVVWGAVVRSEDRPLVFSAALTMVPLIVLGACITGNWNNIAATVSLLLVAWLYSVPPLRLKERPPL